jgi:Domain of unknown function (DUF4184)
MAFTVSHAAVVVPFVRKFRQLDLYATEQAGHRTSSILAGVTLGSMIPDVEKLTPIFRRQIIGARLLHTPLGMAAVGIPLSLLAALLLQWILPNLQSLLLTRTTTDRHTLFLMPRSRRGVLAFCIAALFGGLTHIVWDGFTHRNGFITQRIPILKGPTVLGRWYYVLWFVTSVIGGLVVGKELWRSGRIMRQRGITIRTTRALPIVATCSLAFIFGFIRMHSIKTSNIVAVKFGFLFATGVLAVLCLALAIAREITQAIRAERR